MKFSTKINPAGLAGLRWIDEPREMLLVGATVTLGSQTPLIGRRDLGTEVVGGVSVVLTEEVAGRQVAQGWDKRT